MRELPDLGDPQAPHASVGLFTHTVLPEPDKQIRKLPRARVFSCRLASSFISFRDLVFRVSAMTGRRGKGRSSLGRGMAPLWICEIWFRARGTTPLINVGRQRQRPV
jgi:hypothetical protein